MMHHAGFLGLGVFFGLIVFVIAIAILVFEIAMIVSAIRNRHISQTAKVWWVVGMFLIHPIVAIIYFFTDYQKTK
jgi:hypothetical protein